MSQLKREIREAVKIAFTDPVTLVFYGLLVFLSILLVLVVEVL